MAGISSYLADKINDWLHGDTLSWSPPATTYFALMSVVPVATGGGAEVTGGSYVRKAVTNNATNWPASSSGLKSSGVAITWVTPTADWGPVQGFAEYDAASGGNLLTFGLFAVPTTILSGQPFSLPIGAAQYSWTGGISNYLADKLNDWLHGGGTYTVPATTYFALMTVSPTQSSAGTETSGGAYARASEANNSTDWPNSVSQNKANADAITFPTASGAWTGPEVAVAELDASSAGNLLTFGPVGTPFSVPSGSTPEIPISGAVYEVS